LRGHRSPQHLRRGILTNKLSLTALAALVVALLTCVSLAAAQRSVTTSTAATTVVFGAVADARVHEASPGSNYGTSSTLRTDLGSGANVESFLRFSVVGLSGSVQRALLRVYAYNGTADGPAVYASSSSWSESAITWSSRPALTSGAVADVGALSGSWAEWDVTSLVSGDGVFSFALRATSSDGVDFYSRQSGNTGLRPQLVVETVADGAPVATSPPTISGVAQAGQTLTASSGTWSGTQPISHAYQWQRCSSSGSGCGSVTGETAQTYDVAAADVGSTLRVVVTATNSAGSGSAASTPTAVVADAPPPGDPVIVSAGDIAGCDYSEDEQTAQLVDAIRPTRVVTLGDHAYENGTASEFANCYHPTWGRHRAITTPVAGNHEYNTSGATGYYGYFGAAAGDPARGYYAYDLGSWRLYALNSNCAFVSCAAGAAQEQWLRADLAANPRQCTLAFMHHPRFASGDTSDRRSTPAVGPLYQAFYEASGDVFLVAHNHFYERLGRLAPDGSVDLQRGIRNFVVGTGGRFLYDFGAPIRGSEVRHNANHGVLELTLRATGYSWRFVSVAGGTSVDNGSDTCGAYIDTTPPSPPTDLGARVVSSNRVDLTWTASGDDVGVTGYDVYRGGALLATTTGTTYSDTTVVAGTTYSYLVRARDAASNVSGPSNTATATPGGAGATVVFGAVADARVLEASPASNFGSSSSLRTELDPGDSAESFVRFSVAGLAGPVRRAVLRVYAFNATADGPAVYGSLSAWSESGITWSNRPALTTGVVADVRALPAGSWVEWDVTSSVSGPGEFSFALRPTSSDGVDFYSRQSSNTALRPQLVIETG
jgi:hypothetical protein